MIRHRHEMKEDAMEKCHNGTGKITIRTVLKGADSRLGIRFMHDDVLAPGTSIGEHPHADTEELYFVVDGHGTMMLDGQAVPIGPGDVSLVACGHAHGIVNSPDGPMRLIVLAVK